MSSVSQCPRCNADDPGWYRAAEDLGRMVGLTTGWLPDGRSVSWSPRVPHLTGDPELVAAVRAWLGERTVVSVTPTGPTVAADEADRRAAFTAMREVAPGAEWDNPPSLLFGQSPDTVF